MPQRSRYSIPDQEWEKALKTLGTPSSLPPDISIRRKLHNNAVRKYIDTAGEDSLKGISIQEQRIDVPQPDGQIGIRIYTPDPVHANERFPFLLNLHGGAYCLGNLDTDELKCRSFCSKGRLVVVNVDYRLAPEFSWPSGREDSYAAFKWAMENTQELKVDISKGCIICGLSIGALFAIVLTFRARSSLRYQGVISGQLLQFPPTWSSGDCEYEGDLKDKILSFEHTKDDLLVSQANIRMIAEAYRPRPSTDIERIECSPLLVESTRGLPAAYIQIAGRDPYRDEGLLYAQRLEAEDVPVNVKVYPGVPHDFANLLPHLQISQRWRDDYHEGLKWLIHTTKRAKKCKL